MGVVLIKWARLKFFVCATRAFVFTLIYNPTILKILDPPLKVAYLYKVSKTDETSI